MSIVYCSEHIKNPMDDFLYLGLNGQSPSEFMSI